MSSLTVEQRIETYVQAIIAGDSQSDAYRKAYPASLKWKADSVHNKASAYARDARVLARLDALRKPLARKFTLKMEDILNGLTNIALNDPAQMYDENGNIKNIHDIPKEIRMTMSAIEMGSVNKTYLDDLGNEVTEPSQYIARVRQEARNPALKQLYEWFKGEEEKPPEEVARGVVDTKHLARKILKLVHDGASKK